MRKLHTVPERLDISLILVELISLTRIRLPVAVPGESHEDVDEFANLGNEDIAAVEESMFADEPIGECNLGFRKLRIFESR